MVFYLFFLYADWAPFILRLALGVAFIAHGYPKLYTKERRDMFAGWLESLGIRPGRWWGLWVGCVEFFGGILLILGAYVEFVSFLLVIDMMVAMVKVKWGKVGYTAQGGWELDVIYLVIALSLILTGAGAWSLDSYILRQFPIL